MTRARSDRDLGSYTIMMTTAERIRLSELADANRQTLSEYIRRRILPGCELRGTDRYVTCGACGLRFRTRSHTNACRVCVKKYVRDRMAQDEKREVESASGA